METRFFKNIHFCKVLHAMKIHSFHNPNYTTVRGFGLGPDCLHARDEHRDPPAGRRNLLYESSPAETMVDGSPRAASRLNTNIRLAP